ncbi:MAG: hypothetical protein H6767_06620 [Candidatus Peribacteria bacterium]|nr:MAG: hypothetical protein H6767_06620 [Candidatus Peribacteria bacterium]
MLRKSDLKEDGDVTVLDYLVSGQDILNRGYAPKDYSGVDTFDAQLNTELQKVYDNDSGTNLDKRKRRQKVEAAQRVMSEKLSIVRSYISGVMGGKFSSESHSTRVQSLNAELTALDSKLADTLKPIIESYSLYLELEIEIKPFEGSWGANRNDVLD